MPVKKWFYRRYLTIKDKTLSEYIVVSAAPFEVEPLMESSWAKKNNVSYFSVGIGPINASKAEAQLKEQCKNKKVLFIGSCGSFDALDTLQLVTVQESYFYPPCLREGQSWIIDDLYPKVSWHDKGAQWVDLPCKIALTSPTIGKTNTLPEELLEQYTRADLIENMELYCCVPGAAEVASEVSVILAVTNAVGPKGHDDWVKNFRQGAQKVSDYVLSSVH